MATTRNFLKELAYHRYAYLLTLPGVIFFLLFNYIPLVGITIAFQDFNPIKGLFNSEWVGLQNFSFFFTSSAWKKVTLNTLYLNTLFISTGIVVSLIIAVMISEISLKGLKRLCQSLILLPYFISWPIVSLYITGLLGSDTGLINTLLASLGYKRYLFYQTPEIWPLILVLLRLMKGVGVNSIIFLAAITNIDPQLYESALIDGANRFHMIRYITVPLIRSTAILLLLLSVGRIFYGDFGMIYAVIGDNPILFPTTDVIDTFVFRALRGLGSTMGMAAAVGLYQSCVGFIIVFTCNYLARRLNQEAALF